MNIVDVDNNSRLIAAKQKIFDIISDSRWYDFALSIFAWESQRVLPFTSDVPLFVTFLNGIDSNNLTVQWTDINLTLEDALESFGDDYSWNIIILTDGDEQEINISWETLKSLKAKNLVISLIGVGSLEWGVIPTWDIFNPYKRYNGEVVKLWLNESWLRNMTKKLDWEYYDYRDDINLRHSEEKNKNLEKKYLFLYLALLTWGIYLGTVFYALYYAKK
jgi:hypothetical protein